MALRFLTILTWTLFFWKSHSAQAPPTNALIQPALSRPAAVRHNLTVPRNSFTFSIPGTTIDLILSDFHGLLNQGELDLCIIEGLGEIFKKVISKGSDGGLPLNTWTSKYGNVVINLYDFSPPAFHMTYGSVVTTLRGIALFASQHGYVQMQLDVFDEKLGHVGTGELGQILPFEVSKYSDNT